MSDYICYCLLQDGSGSRKLAERLSKLQEYYERTSFPDLPSQAFVYGDHEAVCRPFQTFPRGWKTGIDAGMGRCRLQDMMALSWHLLSSVMGRQAGASCKLVFLSEISLAAEEESAVIVGDQLRKLKEQGLEIIFVSCSPEADAGPLRALADLEIGAGEDAAFILGGS